MRPLIVVPALFGTEIRDDGGRFLWGRLRNLYGGPALSTPSGTLPGRPGDVLPAIRILPGVRYDIIGALCGALARAGYRPSASLFLFAYDWRRRVLDVGDQLAAEIRRLADRAGREVDVLGLSNGGLVVRAAFAADATLPVHQVVTSGTPHAGSLETLACLHAGFQFAPLGRRVGSAEFLACPGSLDCLPGPGEPCFLDGKDVWDLYDVATWETLRLAVFQDRAERPEKRAERGVGSQATLRASSVDRAFWRGLLRDRLARTRETWSALADAAPPARLTCVVGEGLRTQTRIVVEDGRAVVPGEGRVDGLPEAALADGDGGVTRQSATAWRGRETSVVTIPVSRHRDVVKTRPAFDAILAGLAGRAPASGA